MDEVFSSADGKAQFIELQDPANGEDHLAGHFISSNEKTFTFPTNLPTTATANQHLLLGTASYAALPGAVQPDYILPDNFFNPAGDSLDYADVDAFSFTAGQVPTDGVNALLRNVTTFALSTGPNTETNLAGQTGSVSDVPKTGYLQVNLVSDLPGNALIQDPQLINPWGIGQSATSPIWVSDNGADVSTIYSGDVAGSPFSKAALVVSIPGGAPTGQLANGTSNFSVSAGAATGPARFIFASESGNITGWNPGVPAAGSTQAEVGATTAGAVYKGIALANNGTANQLYAANFNSGAIDVFDSSFHPVTLAAGAFTDPNLPAGYAPFNIANLGGQLYVAYALQDAAKHDDVAGFGHGFVDVYDVNGVLLKRLITGHPGTPTDPMNSPWGMTLAPANFGDFSGDLLVGNFGNGKINAFDPSTGAFRGSLSDAAGNPIVIDGLWALQFGNGAGAGDANKLFFTAGSGGEQHGLLGSIISAQNTPLSGDGTKITATEGTTFSGAIAAFASSNTAATAGAFTATIDWGDGSSSVGTVVANGDGGFNVLGSHAYVEEAASEIIHVTVTDGSSNTITLNASAKVIDATLSATGVPVSLQQSLTLNNVAVATFSDSGGAEPAANYTATIDWGDGTTADVGNVNASGGTFTVTGSHIYASDGHRAIAVTIKDEGGASATAASSAQAGYLQLNLVSDQAGAALILDPNLVNPWGIAQSATSPFWISDNGADVATIYSGDVSGSPFSKAGLVVSIPGGAPTGQVANSTSDFVVSSGSASAPALFIFASENGDITGWNPTVPPPAPSTHAQTGVSVPDAVFKGLALANNGTANFLYATDFHNGQIDVFDSSFHQVTQAPGAFADPNLPAGYAPFNIANLGGKLYVTYALQDAAKHDDSAGFGHGFVDIYDTSGVLLQRLITGTPGDPASPLNSPWGLAIAPANFGDFSGDLLVGNFGNGWINAFDPTSGAFLGSLSDASGKPIVIDGLWGLQFGNGTAGGDANTLFFTAGTGSEQHGLFGALVNAENTPLTGEGAKLAATEGASFSGNVATFASSDTSASANDFTATIVWANGSTSAGSIASNGDGGFVVVGSHTFAEEGTNAVSITIHDSISNDNLTINATATVADAPIHASGVPVNPSQGVTVNNAEVATFTDDGSAEPIANYTATIDWGDGTSSSGVVSLNGATFQVAGSHTYTAGGVHAITTSIKDEGGSTATATSSTSSGYLQLNLVSDQPGDALLTDPDLVNPWGISLPPTTGAFWVSDNGADVATLYAGAVAGSPFSKSGLVVSIPGGAPTGQVFNSTSDFKVSSGGASAPALFIFASENGSITGWNPAVPPPTPSTTAQTGVTIPGAVFKGLALASNGGANFLYATDFHNGQIDVFDSSFHQVALAPGAFTDPSLPAGYAPFNITNLGGKLYVSYALQDAEKHDDVAGAGHGFVDVYDAAGVMQQRLITGVPGDANSPLNSPWGMVIAPANFGDFSGDLLVGNFGDGKIHAFDPNTGALLGAVSNPDGNPITIDGLWGLAFGNGATAGDKNVLFFSAGSDGEQHGLFGALENAQNTPLAGEAAKLSLTEGASFSGTVATFAASDVSAQAASFTANIDWGDGQTSTGTVVSNSDGGFNVLGSHVYAEEATHAIHVTVTDNAQRTITIIGSAAVADAPLIATGETVKVDRHDAAPIIVATFADAGGAEAVANYSATVDWGDGSPTTSGIITLSGGGFSISGVHDYEKPGRHTVTVTIKDEGGATTSTTSKATVGNDHERLVEQFFEQLLDRDADDNGLNFFLGLLNQGKSAADIVAQIEATTEFLAAEVQALFQQLLHRGAEPSAVSFFSKQLSAGQGERHAEGLIISSPEYFQLHGGNGNAFLDAMYQDLLNRGIDPGAESFWSSKTLTSSSARDQIAAAVFSSDEFLTNLIEHDMQQFLGRPVDAEALKAFLKALQNGETENQLRATILSSPEFAGNV